MADYHPLIARAVTGLEKNTGENRRALYERARVALVAQLRGVVPALEESEITRERLALEEAIRKVEAEAARQAREVARPKPARRTEIPKREEPVRREESPRREEAPRQPPRASRPQSAEGPSRYSATPPSTSELASAPTPLPPPPFPPIGPRRSLQDEALKRFRETPPPPPEQRSPRPTRSFESPEDGVPPAGVVPPGPTEPWPRQRHSFEEFGQLEPQHPDQPENLWALPLDNTQARPPIDLDARQSAPQQHEEPRYESDEPEPPAAPRSYGKAIRAGLVVLLLLVFGSLVWWQWTAITGFASVVATMFQPSPPPPREAAAPARPKIADRIGQPQPSSGPAVAQRVVLYEEEPDDPQGKRFVGTVLWRTEMRPATPGRPPELAVRGDVDVPERQMKVTLSFRRNTDASLPASHTIEIVFTVPADAPSGGVQKVPGVLMKQAEQTRGVPLAGLAVPVTPGYFLIGLSSLESDMQRNVQLLKERAWFDIPLIYNNNRRAILALEKGTPGEQAFNQAFAAWKQ
jgi:hypothetical protein